MTYDYSVYLVTDRTVMSTATLEEAVEQAVLGGCTMVQLREKEISSADFYDSAKEIKQITDRYDIPLIVNNRVDIALAVGAAGVHVGQSDLPACAARKIIGEKRLLGVSVTSVGEAVRALNDGADYLGVGAMFPTKTKKDAEKVSIHELCAIRRAVDIPIVVIGGINQTNAARFRDLGVDGLAVVSAIIAQPDIRRAASELKCAFAKKRR
ncbi:MAG: thiamine phosphate synthase [Eubacterium sp.]|nr:thiamine phosphate synthase [Eubacterium sp.]